jgi:hypothetical protein
MRKKMRKKPEKLLVARFIRPNIIHSGINTKLIAIQTYLPMFTHQMGLAELIMADMSEI